MKSSALLCSLALVATSRLAYAECKAPDCAVEKRGNERVVVLSEPFAAKLSETWAAAPVLLATIDKYKELTTLRASQVDLLGQAIAQLNNALSASQAETDSYRKRAEEESKRVDEERARADSVWRSPILWATAGAVAGGAVATCVLVAARK